MVPDAKPRDDIMRTRQIPAEYLRRPEVVRGALRAHWTD